MPVLASVFEAQNESRLQRWLGETYIGRENLVTLSARAGAYEPPKAAKEHVTTMPSKYKVITYSLCTSAFEHSRLHHTFTVLKCLRSRLQAMAEPKSYLRVQIMLERIHVEVDKQQSS